MSVITQALLKELLDYDPTTGVFRWKAPHQGIHVGDIAGCLNGSGYIYITADRKLYRAHRLAWLYVHGELPPACIDHINGNPSDNRLENLRPATNAENQHNRKTNGNNTSGFKGVSWHTRDGKWRAEISVNGKRKHIGYFDTPTEAHAAYLGAADRYFGEFARAS